MGVKFFHTTMKLGSVIIHYLYSNRNYDITLNLKSLCLYILY